MELAVGLPRMTEYPGERRDFLPRFVHELMKLGASEVVIEDGYGSDLGVRPEEYLKAEGVRFADGDTCLKQDVVLVIRCPGRERLELIRPDAILVTMLHFVTRAGRNSYLARRGIHAVSLDSVTDERGRRMIENLEITAWAGVEAAFRQLALTWGWFAVPGREPVHVTVLGSGALGSHAVRAATRYGDHEVRDALHQAGVPGVEVSVLDHDLTWHEAYMLQVLRRTDILVDATLRPDPSVPVVANPWLEVMPPHAVLLDLAADPYDLTLDPPLIKGIEGVPAGTIERHVFAADDPAWDELGENVGTSFRRTALSCNAWPGLRARESMELYGEQLERVMEVVLEVPIQEWDKRTGYQRERAVARAELARWLEGHRW